MGVAEGGQDRAASRDVLSSRDGRGTWLRRGVRRCEKVEIADVRLEWTHCQIAFLCCCEDMNTCSYPAY